MSRRSSRPRKVVELLTASPGPPSLDCRAKDRRDISRGRRKRYSLGAEDNANITSSAAVASPAATDSLSAARRVLSAAAGAQTRSSNKRPRTRSRTTDDANEADQQIHSLTQLVESLVDAAEGTGLGVVVKLVRSFNDGDDQVTLTHDEVGTERRYMIIVRKVESVRL